MAVIPKWLSLAFLTLNTPHVRNRGEFNYRGKPIGLEFLDDSQVAVVQTYYNGRELIPGDIIWVKGVASDGITLLDIQHFSEGALGALRGFILIHTVEGAKVEALEGVANKLSNNLLTYLRDGSDGELPWALAAHLAVLDSFSETEEGDFGFAQRQIRRMLSVHDRTGRPNLSCRIMGQESTMVRIRKVSKKRQATVGAAALAAATLGEVLKNYEAFLMNVKMFLESKLNANTWSMNKRHRRWLEDFAKKLSMWAADLKKIDMQPFVMDAGWASDELTQASEAINEALQKYDEEHLGYARDNLGCALKNIGDMLLRFEVARALRVVSFAADDRVREFKVKVTKPNWLEIEAIARRATEAWQVTNESVIEEIGARDAERAYRAFRKIVSVYDDASRAAAA